MNVKKIISVLLAMLIVTTSFSLLPVSASALETEETKETVITESGTTGDCTFAAEIDSESVELGVINLPDDEDAPNYPEIIKFENTNNGVMVYWTAFPGAESYRLFYWNGEKWRSVGSTSELSYLHKNVENGKSYLYIVRAVDEWGEYCSDFNRDGYENVYLVKENTENELVKKSGTTGDCTWELDEDGTLTISGDGDMEDYSINDYESWGDTIKTVIINAGVTNIGNLAFANCTSLTSITIPDSVTSIGNDAFSECESLTNIVIPDSVTSIGDRAFDSCRSLTSITIPNSVASIGYSAFSFCESLTSITLPDSVTSIGESAFCFCRSLMSITIPNSVTKIGESAFYFCRNLTSITIPSSVTSIGDDAFGWCTSLTSITIPNSVTSIGASAFCECISLKSIEIPKKVTSIGDQMFYGCINLESLTIPSNVTSIGESAFCRCTSLNSITIPSSVKSIGEHAFGFFYNFNLNTHHGEYTKIEDFVIIGKSGSEAQSFAKENGFRFIDTNFEWGIDNWSFDNKSVYFNYDINDNDTKIIQNIEEKFDLSELQINKLNAWFTNKCYMGIGMCFGMTVSEIFARKGILKLSEYGLNDIINYNDINNSNTRLVISVIQGIQNIRYGDDYLQSLKLSTFNPDDYKQSDFLSNIETKLTNDDNLVMIGYTKSNTNIYHAVLGYGIEKGNYKYGGKDYDRKILIADPDYLSANKLNADACIYYNSNHDSWACPIRQYYWNGDSNSNAKIYDILIDTDPKDSSVSSKKGGSENHYIAGINIYDKSGNQHTIEQVEGTGDPKMDYTGDGSGIERYYIDGGSRAELYALWNPTADYIVKYSTPSDYNMKMDYEHVTYYANVENGNSTLVKPEGTINIKGSDANYSITMLTDDSERVTDWYALTVSGNNTDEVTLKKHENGYILSSDNLQNIEIKAEKGDVEAVKTFSTTYNSVFIYEIDENTIGIKVDVDGDGTYETELSDVQSTYQIGDVDFDGILGINDATLIQYYLAEFADFSDEQRDIADLNRDGEITIEDATQMQLYLAELI